MSTEKRSHLREYCTSCGCGIWEMIKEAEKQGNEAICAIGRQHCGNNCAAYQYNRWLYTVNKEIVDRKGGGRYL